MLRFADTSCKQQLKAKFKVLTLRSSSNEELVQVSTLHITPSKQQWKIGPSQHTQHNTVQAKIEIGQSAHSTWRCPSQNEKCGQVCTLSMTHTHAHIPAYSSFCFRYVPSASEPIWFFSLTCRGNESSVAECRSNGFNITNRYSYYYESNCRQSYGPFSVKCYHNEIGEGN